MRGPSVFPLSARSSQASTFQRPQSLPCVHDRVTVVPLLVAVTPVGGWQAAPDAAGA